MGNILNEANLKKVGMLVLALFLISQIGAIRSMTGLNKGVLPNVQS